MCRCVITVVVCVRVVPFVMRVVVVFALVDSFVLFHAFHVYLLCYLFVSFAYG